MKVRLLKHTIYGPAGAKVERDDKQFLDFAKKNPRTVRIINDKPKKPVVKPVVKRREPTKPQKAVKHGDS